MDRIEDEGTNLLAPLRDAAPSGQSGVDIAKAKSIGRRQSRRRVVAGMVAAASLVVVAGIGVPMLIHNLPDTSAPARPAEEFDIFKRVVSVGSGGGFTPDTYETFRDRQVITLIRADGGQGTATIEVFSPASSPAYPDKYDERADDVNGREAYWVDSEPVLAWKWAEHGWATVTWENVPDVDVKDKIHRVAQSVLPGEEPVTMPFTMARNGALTLQSVQVSKRSPVSMVVFTYTSPNDGTLYISVGLRNAEPGLVADTDVNGHPATANSNLVKILDTGHNLVAMAGSDGKYGAPELLKQLAASIKAVPDPDDRATWSPTLWR
jgi:hypothetical protein